MTLRASVEWAEAELRNSPHPERARLDAETLLLHLLKQNRAWLLAHWEDEAPPEVQSAFGTLIQRRCTGEPIQHITGVAEFFGLPFHVTRDVLIPRPETEHLVEEVLRLAAAFPAPKIADIGTGSGAIAVALAHSLPDALLTAIDQSQSALAIALQNAQRNQVADRIAFLEGDLLAPLAGQRFDIIASNPPYVPLVDQASLSVEVRDHEPHSALFAGEDGLAIYTRLIPEAREHLAPGGWLVMEIGYGQREAIEEILLSYDYGDVHFIADYQGIPRVAVAQRPG
jgi:release factor glutamine methyltransferase